MLNKAGAGGETILLADKNSNSNPVSSHLTNSLNGNSSNINNNWAPGLGTNDFSNPDVINDINSFAADLRAAQPQPVDEITWLKKINTSELIKNQPPIKE